jgi:hypothetical protein
LATVQIPLLQGPVFGSEDALFPDEDPLGRQPRFGEQPAVCAAVGMGLLDAGNAFAAN